LPEARRALPRPSPEAANRSGVSCFLADFPKSYPDFLISGVGLRRSQRIVVFDYATDVGKSDEASRGASFGRRLLEGRFHLDYKDGEGSNCGEPRGFLNDRATSRLVRVRS
jgi:hypothetical protein